MSNYAKLLDLADDLDSKGLEKQAQILDQFVEENSLIKEAKKGMHKCGLKEETVSRHEELMEAYEKSMHYYKSEYKKLMRSNNEKDSSTQGPLRDFSANFAYNCNAVRYHNMYFDDVINSKPFGLEKDKNTKDLLKELYEGGPDKFETELKRLSKVSRNGWVILNYCTMSKKLYLDVIDLHDEHVIACSLPVLALDMWEHAYCADFGLDKEAYVDWFLSRVDFRNVRKRIKNFQRIR